MQDMQVTNLTESFNVALNNPILRVRIVHKWECYAFQQLNIAISCLKFGVHTRRKHAGLAKSNEKNSKMLVADTPILLATSITTLVPK